MCTGVSEERTDFTKKEGLLASIFELVIYMLRRRKFQICGFWVLMFN